MKLVSDLARFGLINLIIVALIGVIMRYKIGFEFPYFDQRHLQHGHSHFAFAGWVTHILYLLLSNFLTKIKGHFIESKKYKTIIYINLVCAYGMLIAFILQGYGFMSILFSTISVVCSYLFAWYFIKDIKRVTFKSPAINWFVLSLIFNVLSSIGTFSLAYMMGTKSINQHMYLGSVYFYLHFQYSGWFFFGCMGLLISKLHEIIPSGLNVKKCNIVFFYFAIASVPAYLLSILWSDLPWYLYIFAIFAVILQFIGLWKFILLLKMNINYIKEKWSPLIKLMYGLSFLALIIKLILQGGSIFPEISTLAFGFRSIVIAYLHLVLLGIITIFLFGALLHEGYIHQSKGSSIALIAFCIGVFLNEFVLMLQGIASFSYQLIPYLNEALFAISILLFMSLALLLLQSKEIKPIL